MPPAARMLLNYGRLSRRVRVSPSTSLSSPLFLCAARFSHRKSGAAKSKPLPPPPPAPPKPPPRKPAPFTLHGFHWHDPYSWMSDLHDRVAMRHVDVLIEQEERYADAVMAPHIRLQNKLQSEISVRLETYLCSPPVRWGPWLYYRRVEEGKQHPVLCRRSARLHQEFISHSTPWDGFDFQSGRRIEQRLLDYNVEAERFGGYAYEDRSEISPDHRFLAYTMYDKDKDAFTLSVKDIMNGSLLDRPRADRVSQLAWAMDGKALLYTVRDSKKRPYQIFCSFIGSDEVDVLVFEEPDENIFVNIRNTKDFQYVSVTSCSNEFTKVHLINAADPLSGMKLIFECAARVRCAIEHHRGDLYMLTDASRAGTSSDSRHLLRSVTGSSSSTVWEDAVIVDPGINIDDADFCDTHIVMVLREGKSYKICSVPLPLPVTEKGATDLHSLQPRYLPLPRNVCQISPGPNYDYYSTTMRFTLSSPVMPDAVVDYGLLDGKWKIVQQSNFLHERTQVLYGTSSKNDKRTSATASCIIKSNNHVADNLWNDLSEFYSCELYDVSTKDGVSVPLTIVYSKKERQDGNPGLLRVHGAYGEILEKRWQSELKSLLDRGWVIAYADVRGSGGYGKSWHLDGIRSKKQNSINDYISCADFLIKNGIVQENKLAGWGYSAGGLVVASAINIYPELFRAAVLKVPFLDPHSTLMNPILPLDFLDYEEFGHPAEPEDFEAMRKFSPYENIQKDTLYPAVLIMPSFNTRFGVWEAAKWVSRVRESTIPDPARPIILNVTMDMMEESKYIQSKELAYELTFLIKTVVDS